MTDISGRTIVHDVAAVSAGGWVALPKHRSLGGYDWILHLGGDRQAAIEEGLQDDLDQVGLWRAATDGQLPSLKIAAWQPEGDLMWFALNDLPDVSVNTVAIEEEQRWFSRVMFAHVPAQDGVVVQDHHIVGWTFAEYPNRGFMWRGPPSSQIFPDLRVNDHYRLTFSGGREEAFVLALSMDSGYSDTERLAALANAFRSDARLPGHSVSAYWNTDTVLSQMRLLIDQLIELGMAGDAANAFDAPILIEAGDAGLTSAVVEATLQAYGYRDAIFLVEDLLDRTPVAAEADGSPLAELHAGLYRSWLAAFIEDRDPERGYPVFEQAYERLSDDPQVLILGVRLALLKNDWQTAEGLLSRLPVTAELADQIRLLQLRVSELKSLQNKVVIRFAPGSQHIPVTAVLNESYPQRFIVDTGATSVTIPTATAEALGLNQLDQYPERTVYTAGGSRKAVEVMLASITVDGWQVRDVTALVLDLPGQTGLGLLGLNFLNRFRMDLNSEQGLLLLAPR